MSLRSDRSLEIAPIPRVPPMSPYAWKEPAFRYYFAANLLLRAGLGLFRAGFLSRPALSGLLAWAERLTLRGAASLRRRRPRLSPAVRRSRR